MDDPALTHAPTPIVLSTKPADPPIACTLAAGSVPDRLEEWRALLDQARSRTTMADGGVRLEFGDGVDLGELARLVAEEQTCCAFFSFAITIDARGTALEVRAPDAAAEIVTSMFGA